MNLMRHNVKRILVDGAGYLLLIAALATGWLPGPGGIPLALAGLGLLSINNAWAKQLREWTLRNGGKLTQVLFPKNQWVEWGYDILVLLLFAAAAWLAAKHAAIWQVGVSTTAFFIALFVALTNRDRLNRLRGKHKQ